MPKDKKKPAAPKRDKKPGAKKSGARSEVSVAVRAAKKKAVKLASNPVVAEVVAATLVAAAAALKNPKKARDMAVSAADEISAASKATAKDGNALWQLALDIAKRSVESLATDSDPAPAKKGKKKKAAK